MKKIIALMLVLIMVLSMAACGSSESADPETPAQPDTPVLDMPTVDPNAPEDAPAETPSETPDSGMTMGQTLKAEFETLVAGGTTDPQAIADALIANKVIEFAGATMPVEPGYLAGFSNEISGFEQGVMFAPMIGSIAFVGYVFTVDGDAAVFEQTLLDNADPRWNICVEAGETVSAVSGNLVFFLMCP